MKKKILVCAVIDSNPTDLFIESLRVLKENDNYNIVIHIYDYRIIRESDLVIDGIKVKQLDFDKKADFHNEISSSLFSTGATIFLYTAQNVSIPKDFLDSVNVDNFSDENVGSIYTDFYIKSKDGCVGFLHKSMPLAASLLPVLLVSRDHFLKNIDSGRDSISNAINNSVSIHIPKKMFTLNIDG